MKDSLTRFLMIAGCVILATVQFSFAADYTLSMLPGYSTAEINNRIVPLAQYLTKKTGLQITPTLTSTFDQYLKQLSSGGIDIGFENPYVYVLASKAHEVAAMAVKGKDGDKLRGIIIVRSSSSLNETDDLIGKTIAIVGYTSAEGYLSQKLTLLENDIDVNNDCTVVEVFESKPENVIFSVYTGDADAGFIHESALGSADGFVPPGAIRVMGSSAWLPNWAFSLSRRMSSEDRQKIVAALQGLKPDDPVLKALGIQALRPAHDSEYNAVRNAAGLDLP